MKENNIKLEGSDIKYLRLENGNIYAPVNERVLEFIRRVKGVDYDSLTTMDFFPEINEWVVKVTLKVYFGKDKSVIRVFEGIASKKAGDPNLQWCETIALGRALAKMGIGIEGGKASADELAGKELAVPVKKETGEDGQQILFETSEVKKEKSKSISKDAVDAVSDKIKQKKERTTLIDKKEKIIDGLTENEIRKIVFTEDWLKGLGSSKDIFKIADAYKIKYNKLPGSNTNKKLRFLIIQAQEKERKNI